MVGVDIDYEVFGEGGMVMVSLSGTAALVSSETLQEKPPKVNNTAIRPRHDKPSAYHANNISNTLHA